MVRTWMRTASGGGEGTLSLECHWWERPPHSQNILVGTGSVCTWINVRGLWCWSSAMMALMFFFFWWILLSLKERFFKKMRRNILYLRDGRHIEHEVAPTMACCCLYSEAPQGWGPGLFCFYGDRKFLGQDLRHSEPSANISWMNNKRQHLLGAYYLRHLSKGFFFFLLVKCALLVNCSKLGFLNLSTIHNANR